MLARRLLTLSLAFALVAPPAVVAGSAPDAVAIQQPKSKRKAARRSAKSATSKSKRGTARATAAAAPAAGTGWTSPKSASALSNDLGAILSRREDGKWGAMVVSLTRGDTLFALAPDEPRTPASTFKMFTSVLALDRLGPNWQFSTDVLRDGPVGADGTLNGNLYMRGDGDPSFSKRWIPGATGLDAPLQELADKVAAAGIKHVHGDIVADASGFESRTIPEGWLSRYAGSGYAAPFSALSLNENIVVVAVYPDGTVKLEPATTGIQVENQLGGRSGGLHIYRAPDGHVVVRGSRPGSLRRLQLTVSDPPMFTAGALQAALQSKGIAFDGKLRTGTTPASATVVATHQSVHLSELLSAMNRESINHFAELIFRNAVRGPKRDTVGSAEAGNALLKRFLQQKAGASPNAVATTDGCGLSVLDHVTPRAMIQMLSYAHKSPWGSAFHASLPVAGESELLRNRMKSTPAQGNLHAKTGTTNDVIGLGGYVTAEDGEVLAFSFLFNGHDRWNARATIDRMGATMAAFSR